MEKKEVLEKEKITLASINYFSSLLKMIKEDKNVDQRFMGGKDNGKV